MTISHTNFKELGMYGIVTIQHNFSIKDTLVTRTRTKEQLCSLASLKNISGTRDISMIREVLANGNLEENITNIVYVFTKLY